MLEVTAQGNAVLIGVKVVPGASRTRYMGEWDGLAKVAVAAPPEKGQANKAVVALLAELFSVRKRDVTVVAGHTTPVKKMRIERISECRLRAALQANSP